jgi:hypothetical protein
MTHVRAAMERLPGVDGGQLRLGAKLTDQRGSTEQVGTSAKVAAKQRDSVSIGEGRRLTERRLPLRVSKAGLGCRRAKEAERRAMGARRGGRTRGSSTREEETERLVGEAARRRTTRAGGCCGGREDGRGRREAEREIKTRCRRGSR